MKGIQKVNWQANAPYRKMPYGARPPLAVLDINFSFKKFWRPKTFVKPREQIISLDVSSSFPLTHHYYSAPNGKNHHYYSIRHLFWMLGRFKPWRKHWTCDNPNIDGFGCWLTGLDVVGGWPSVTQNQAFLTLNITNQCIWCQVS